MPSLTGPLPCGPRKAVFTGSDKRLIAVDSDLDGAALAAKGVRFSTQEAYLSESLAEDLAPLFDADTRLVILPDGTAVEQDDLTPQAASPCGALGTACWCWGTCA